MSRLAELPKRYNATTAESFAVDEETHEDLTAFKTIPTDEVAPGQELKVIILKKAPMDPVKVTMTVPLDFIFDPDLAPNFGPICIEADEHGIYPEIVFNVPTRAKVGSGVLIMVDFIPLSMERKSSSYSHHLKVRDLRSPDETQH